jgi:curved DNA-binding protein CbpA
MLRDFIKPHSYYEILKVQPDATDAQVRQSYADLLQHYNSDTTTRNKRLIATRLRLLTEAYAALRTREGRNRYNRLLLTAKGKPKGLVLKADNDNRSASNDRNLWSAVAEFLKPQKTEKERG